MTSREKVILGLTVAAAIGAGLYYASGMAKPAPASPKVAQTDFNALIAKVQVKVQEGELTDREERVLKAATMQWLRSPLRARPLVVVQDSESPPLPRYIGFINTGRQPIAIIDGQDYRPGEMIQGGEFELSEVQPDHIKLLRRGATEPVQLPLEQAQPTGESQ